MTYINLKNIDGTDAEKKLYNRFYNLCNMRELAGDKVDCIVKNLLQIVEKQKYFAVAVNDENNNKQFIFVDSVMSVPNFLSWMSTTSDNQLRDVVNRISFIYNTKILELEHQIVYNIV